MMNGRNVSLFSLAILSGSREAVKLIFDLVVRVFGYDRSYRNGHRVVRFVDADGGDQADQAEQGDQCNRLHDTIWSILTGRSNATSSLTCAASVSMEADGEGRTMFGLVYDLLEKQAMQGARMRKFRELLSPVPVPFSTTMKPTISPLAGAVFSSNWVLFREVYDRYEKLAGCCWLRETVLSQIPPGPPHDRCVLDDEDLHECHEHVPPLITRGAWTIPAVMWPDIVKAYQRGQPQTPQDSYSSCGTRHEPLPSWRDDFKHYSRRGVKVAADWGNFAGLRELVHEGFPLHDDHIRSLLENIGDHEQDVMDTILDAVASSSRKGAAQNSYKTLRSQRSGAR
ncbi:unnamed protein product [Ectocarpus sp. 13 AM-2016]